MPRRDFARKIASVFSRAPPEIRITRRHERFVQSRAIWVLSRIDSLYIVPARLFLRPRETPRARRGTGFNSCFGFSAREMSATSLRGTDKIDFSLSWNDVDVDVAYKRQQRRGPATRKRTSRGGESISASSASTLPPSSSSSGLFSSPVSFLAREIGCGLHTLRLAWVFSTA